MRSQNPVAIRYTVDDGLPSNEVYDAYEDREGNVWFATDHGISKFDGYAFQNFSQADGLACNTIFGFEEDPAGRVWMRGIDGSLSYLHDGRIRPYPLNDRLKAQLKGAFINTMAAVSAHEMYVTVAPWLPQTYRLDLATAQLNPVTFPSGTNAGLIQAPEWSQPVFAIAPQPEPEGKPEIAPAPICDPFRTSWQVGYAYQKRLRLSRTAGVALSPGHWIAAFADNLFDLRGCHVSPPKPLPVGFNSLTQDRNGKVWLATSQGLQCIGPNLETTTTLFPKENVFGMMHDSNRSYWLCTLNGVLLIRNLSHRVYDQIHGEPLQNVNRLRLADSTLYVLCNLDSILVADVETDGMRWKDKRFLLNMAEGNHDFLAMPELGRLYSGKFAFDLASGKAVPSQDWKNQASSARKMVRQGNRIYTAASFGFWVQDLKTDMIEFSYAPDKPLRFYTSILPTKQGQVWLGTTEGLFRSQGDSLIRYRPEDPLFQVRVTDLAELGNGMIVVATRGSGIYAFDASHVWNLREAHGLVSNMCNRLFVGPSGLWVCTNRGLSLLHPSPAGSPGNGAILNYNLLDGLPSNKVNDILEYDGNAYIATDLGIVTIGLNHLNVSHTFPTTKITALLADGQSISPGQTLGTDEDNLEFRFQGRLLPALGNVRYRYRLQGYDHDWRVTEGRSAYYYDLPPGHYTFEVATIYPSAAQNPNLARWEVNLPPKLVEQLWFRISAGIGLMVMMGLVIWLGMRSRHRRTENNLRRLQAEIKALRSQMRPHFIFNALNSIQHLIKLQDHETAERHLLGFSKLMRAILEASNHESIPISKEIGILLDYLELEKLRFGPEFNYFVEQQAGVDWEQCQIPPMLLQPLLENAIWHGLQMQKDEPTLWLRLGRSLDGSICIEVEDNGIGRQASAQIARKHLGPSLALSNIQERIRLINATHQAPILLVIEDLVTHDGQARGTLVKLYLPAARHVNRVF